MACAEGGKRDVAAIWQRLKQQGGVSKDKIRLESLWKHLECDAARKQPPDTSKQLLLNSSTNFSGDSSNSKSLQPACKAAKSSLADDAVVNKLSQALQSLDSCVVKSALHQLQAMLAVASPCSSTSPAAKLGKALLRCFEHRSEACRDMSASCFMKLLQVDADSTLSMLPYAMPVLVERLQCDESHNPAEPSEEVRLQLLRLLSLIMDQAGSAIAAYASEVWSILSAVLADSFHEVEVHACKVSQQLAGALGHRLGSTSKELVAALLPLTTHKRYRVRIAALGAIRDVVHQGAHEMILEMVAWRDPNVVPIKAFYGDDIKVNFFGKLASDHHVQVRLAFLEMVGSWMLTLRERRDHEAGLLPYILSGLCDDAPAVVNAALQLLDQLGQLYEQEHEKELADVVRFAEVLEGGAGACLQQLIETGHVCYTGLWSVLEQPDAAASSQVSSALQWQQRQPWTAAAGEASQPRLAEPGCSTSAAGAGAAAAAVSATVSTEDVFVLPGPLRQRARLGSRLLVRDNFSSLLHALCHDLSSWQTGPRAMSARLLLVSLLLVESAAEQYLQVILPALCTSIDDAEASAAVRGCATVLGCFCSLPLLLDLLEPRLQDWHGVPLRQAAGLDLLAAILRGAGVFERVAGHSDRLLQLVLVDLGVVDSQDDNVQAALQQVVKQLTAPHTLRQLSGGSSRGTCVLNEHTVRMLQLLERLSEGKTVAGSVTV